MKRLARAVRTLWDGWLGAIGGTDRRLMRAAYTEQYEPTSADDQVKDE